VETPLGKGMYIPPIVNFEVVPAALSTTYVCAAQAVTANVPMTLNATNLTSVNGVNNVLFDCARGIKIDITTAIGSNALFTVTGTNINGTNVQTVVTVTAGQTLGYSTYTFSRISSIVANQNIPNVLIGNSSVIGLPFYLNNLSALVSYFFGTGNAGDEAAFVTNPFLAAGTLVAGNPWRDSGAVSLTTIDPNGYVNLFVATDGVKRLKLSYYAYGADASLNALIANEVSGNFPFALPVTTPSFTALPLSQSGVKTAKINRNTSNTAYVYPTLLAQDLIGPSYPNDSVFIAGYAAAKAL